jgi:hypothetical protein
VYRGASWTQYFRVILDFLPSSVNFVLVILFLSEPFFLNVDAGRATNVTKVESDDFCPSGFHALSHGLLDVCDLAPLPWFDHHLHASLFRGLLFAGCNAF